MYLDSEVKHMGKTAHVCDVHMVLPDGLCIAFESKYKGFVEKKDVEKFVSDMKGLISEGNVVGGVFVSFLSKNIPGKGCMNFELLDGKPIMYVAYSDETDFKLHFTCHVKLFERMCYAVHESVGKMGGHLEDDDDMICKLERMMDAVKDLCGRVNRNKKRLDDFKKHVLKFYSDMDDENDQILESLSNMLGAEVVKKKKRVKQQIACEAACDVCGKSYSSQYGLTRHKKKCAGVNITIE
jgi:hypothetical protein